MLPYFSPVLWGGMRKRIWRSMLDADLNARYWGEQSRIAYARDKCIRIFVAATSSGTIAAWSIWVDCPLAWKVLSALSALLAVASPILNFTEKAKVSTMLYCTWSDILRSYEMLWGRIEAGLLSDISKMTSEYNRIIMREKQCDPHEAKYRVDEGLIEECRRKVLSNRGIQ